MTNEINMQKTGIVFNVQRYTVHDGPGIRTELFLKGCPLRCLWCDNPEGFSRHMEVGVYPDRCIGVDVCGYCLKDCPMADKEVLVVEENVIKSVNRELCDNCLKCVEACPGNALVSWGKEMTVDEAVKEVLKDREFYARSGGGVTISGGEPLVQWEFTLAVFQACKKAGIHTCMETTFHGPWEVIEQILKYTDYIITDIKHMDSAKHKECTGVGNELILENLKKMAGMGIPYIIRTPIVPEHNDSPENIRQTAEFIVNEMGNTVKQVQLLPFHEYGKVKYQTLGKKYALEGRSWPSRQEQRDHILKLVEIMKDLGVPVVSGSTTKAD